MAWIGLPTELIRFPIILYHLLQAFAVLSNGLASRVTVSTGVDLARVISDPAVTDAILTTDIYWTSEDWNSLPTPFEMGRSLTIRGDVSDNITRDEARRVLDFGFIASKIWLANGVVLEFKGLLLRNFRIGNHNQAPGVDVLLPTPSGPMSTVLITNCLVVHRACYPVSLQVQSIILLPRPASAPGPQVGNATSPPAPASCVNDTSALPLERCWAHRGMYDDMATYGADLDKYGKLVQTRIVIRLVRNYYLCEVMMTNACVSNRGILGCAYYTFANLDPPGVSAGFGNSSGSSQAANPPQTATSPEGAAAAAAAAAAPLTAAGQRGGGGGAAGGSGASPAVLGAALGASLGGAALLAAAAVTTLALRRRRHRRDQHQQKDLSIKAGGGGNDGFEGIRCGPPCGSLVNGQQRQLAGSGGGGGAHGDKATSKTSCGGGGSGGSAGGGGGSAGGGCGGGGSAGGSDEGALGRTGTLSSPPSTGVFACPHGQDLDADLDLDLNLAGAPRTGGNGNNARGATSDPEDGFQAVAGKVAAAAAAAPATAATARAPDPAVVVTHLTPPHLAISTQLLLRTATEDTTAAAVAATSSQSVPLAGGGGGGGGGEAEVVLLPGAVRGKGATGRVVEGTYRGRRVAVKLLTQLGDRGMGVAAATAGGSAAEGEGGGGGADGGTGSALQLAIAQEVEVLGRCCHPNVVRLLAACVTPPRLCLVMELMETSLEYMILAAPGGLLPMDAVLSIAQDIAAGLEYLHPTIAHRDVKPANVLVNDPLGPRQIAKLSDFGLARLHSTALITKNPEAGTPPYMAPECFSALEGALSHHVDLYSLGMVLWVMLSGQDPWQGLSMVRVAYIVTLGGLRPPLSAIPPGRRLSKLLRLIRTCWEADPRRRPAAAEAAKEIMLAREMLARGDAEEEGPEPEHAPEINHYQAHNHHNCPGHNYQPQHHPRFHAPRQMPPPSPLPHPHLHQPHPHQPHPHQAPLAAPPTRSITCTAPPALGQQHGLQLLQQPHAVGVDDAGGESYYGTGDSFEAGVLPWTATTSSATSSSPTMATATVHAIATSSTATVATAAAPAAPSCAGM